MFCKNLYKIFSFAGMHKKSIEAAETLKSSDENSDKEDEERTEVSDTSSLHRRSPTTPTSTTAPVMNKTKPVSNGSPCSSSISPITMSPPITHQPVTPTQRSSEEAAKGKDFNLMSSPTSRAPSGYHLSPHEHQNPQQQQHPTSLAHHHTHPAHHYSLNPINPSPDTLGDPEVFRWVNYNRDYPVSFIRWISVLWYFLFFLVSTLSLHRNEIDKLAI